ncbi:hypothetical protein Q7P37_002692 [Cladosporium fusiforme]
MVRLASCTTTQSETASPRNSAIECSRLGTPHPLAYQNGISLEYRQPAYNQASNPYIPTSRAGNGALWPFDNQLEAKLMHHYTTNLAPWFDHSDTIKHFGCILPNLAASCPPLLNAILALASRHLCLQGQLEESVTLHYHDACFRTLLPDLQTRAFEAPMLAAVNIILVASHDTASHSLLGLDVFVDAWRRNPTSTLHAAIFMNVVRLYIHVAVIDKQPLSQAVLNCCLIKNMWPNADDPHSVNAQITMLVACVTGVCYDEEPKSSERWLRLSNRLDEWRATMPAAFLPTFQSQPSDDHPCGIVTFANDIHGMILQDYFPLKPTYAVAHNTPPAASHQYYCLARLLLINNTPPGTPQTSRAEEISVSPHTNPTPHPTSQISRPQPPQTETLTLLRRVCAVASSHTTAIGIALMSTLPILAFGHLLPDRASQQQALGILMLAQRNCAAITCPGTNARLRKAWGWEGGEGLEGGDWSAVGNV